MASRFTDRITTGRVSYRKPPPIGKKRLSNTGGLKGPRSAMVNDPQPNAVNPPRHAQSKRPPKIKWGALKTNTVAGNPRQGSQYREGVDPVTGRKFHLYQAEAGGIPKEIFGIGRKRKKLSSKM